MANFGNLLVDAFPSELQSPTLASRIWPVDRFPDDGKEENLELLFAASSASLMSESTKYFTDENIVWTIDEFDMNQSEAALNQPIRYNFDKRRFSGAVGNDFGKNFENWKEANRNEIKLRPVFILTLLIGQFLESNLNIRKPIREFEVIQKSMKNLKQDIEEINQTISNNRGKIK